MTKLKKLTKYIPLLVPIALISALIVNLLTLNTRPGAISAAYTGKGSYTFAWMSDTQYYSQNAPEIFSTMTKWLANEAKSGRVKHLFHTGDVVNTRSDPTQWQAAKNALIQLDGVLNYTIAPGNHDLGKDKPDYTAYLENFGYVLNDPDRNIQSYGGGIVTAEQVEMGNTRFVILAVGYGADKSALDWAGEYLTRHSGHTAILLTHDYMKADGRLSQNGKLLFEKLVRGHPSIKLVLCGHNPDTEKRLTALDDNGDLQADRTVIQLLCDYQALPDGGGGYLRLITIDPKKKKLSVNTYSPYYDDYNCFEKETFPDKDSFTLDISDWF